MSSVKQWYLEMLSKAIAFDASHLSFEILIDYPSLMIARLQCLYFSSLTSV